MKGDNTGCIWKVNEKEEQYLRSCGHAYLLNEEHYQTSCGYSQINGGTLIDNGLKICPYCNKEIIKERNTGAE